MPPKKTAPKSDVAPAQAWWTLGDEMKRALQCAATVDQIQASTSGRIRDFNANLETYNAPERGGSGAFGGPRSGYRASRGSVNKEQVALPVVWSVIQALASEIGTQVSDPQFMLSGGDYKARKNGELLTNLTRGVAHKAEFDAVQDDAFIDACIGGLGHVFISQNWETNQIEMERVFPPEVIVDPNDDLYGKPRSKYRIKYIDREELAERFPKADRTRLKVAKTLSGLSAVGNATQTSMVKVYEAWHLPTSEKKQDGRHLICTSTDSLLDENYARRVFPIIDLKYDKRRMGSQGLGLCGLLGSVQNHLNGLLHTSQRSMDLHGVPHWLCHTNSNINKQELNDLIGSVVYWSGQQPPELATFPSMPSDVMAMIEFDLQQIYQMSGVSLMAASAQKPAGLDSGEAIRAYVDTNSKRFKKLAKQVERWDVAVFDFIAELAMEIAEKIGSYPVHVPKRAQHEHSVEVLDWKAVKGIRRDQWQIECFPISSLPATPTGKLQYVKDLREAAPETMDGLAMAELLELPDTTSFLRLELAGRRLCERLVSDIIDEGKYRPPDADCIPLEWSVKHATQSLANAEIEDAPAENLEKLRTFIAQLGDLVAQATPPAPAPMPPPQGMPAPGAPPMLAPAPQAPLAAVAQPGQ